MPELPEVETIARKLKRDVEGKRVTDVVVLWAGTITGLDPDSFTRRLVNMAILDIWRRGKYIVIELDNQSKLIVHLRMSGRFSLHTIHENIKENKHTRIIIILDNELVLSFIDQRKFGRFTLVDETESIFEHLGPEPLSTNFSISWLRQALSRRSSQIKTLLLNQHFIAGLGNIYANEILWHAKLHPLRKANQFTEQDVERLYHAIVEVLQQAIRHGGTSLDDRQYKYPDGNLGHYQHQLCVYDQAGEKCKRCGYMLERIVQAQRSTYFCPVCQRLDIKT